MRPKLNKLAVYCSNNVRQKPLRQKEWKQQKHDSVHERILWENIKSENSCREIFR